MTTSFIQTSATYSSLVAERFQTKLVEVQKQSRISDQEARQLLRTAHDLIADLLPHVDNYVQILENQTITKELAKA